MLKKSFAFGLLAAGLMVAPGAAFADQSANSTSVTNQNTTQIGVGNVAGSAANTTTVQQQIQKTNPHCYPGNQIATSGSFTGQGTGQAGVGNVAGTAATTTTLQTQVDKCANYKPNYKPYKGY